MNKVRRDAIIVLAMEAQNHTLPPRTVRTCEVCGLAVGIYEPAVFVFGPQVIYSSRAAEPGLAAKPGCRLKHRDCHVKLPAEPHLRLVAE